MHIVIDIPDEEIDRIRETEDNGSHSIEFNKINSVTLLPKHGRLIDSTKMIGDLLTVDPQYQTMIDWCIQVTKAQPTIIEGTEGKE